jgi:hypothetical protein
MLKYRYTLYTNDKIKYSGIEITNQFNKKEKVESILENRIESHILKSKNFKLNALKFKSTEKRESL